VKNTIFSSSRFETFTIYLKIYAFFKVKVRFIPTVQSRGWNFHRERQNYADTSGSYSIIYVLRPFSPVTRGYLQLHAVVQVPHLYSEQNDDENEEFERERERPWVRVKKTNELNINVFVTTHTTFFGGFEILLHT